MYHIQREAFLPSAKAMITSLVLIILVMLMFTDMGGQLESLVTLGFLAFFFVYLLRILNVIDKPFKVGEERTDDQGRRGGGPPALAVGVSASRLCSGGHGSVCSGVSRH